MEVFRIYQEFWSDLQYTDFRARVDLDHPTPRTSDDFIRCAISRGLPNLRCGQNVKVGESDGTVVGHNESANFIVYFSTGKYAGQKMPVHPADLVMI